MSSLPSPTKRATREMAPVELATGSDPRGSLQRAASNSTAQFNASIVEKAMKARQAVQRGQLGMPPPPTAGAGRRPLGPSQSTPVLNFGGSSNAPFVTTNSTLNSVFGDVKRNELQPFFQNIHEDEAERSRRSASQRSLGFEGSGSFGGSAGGYETRETTAMDDGGDGFDMDEVFGESNIKIPGFASQSSFGGQEESQSSAGTARTITQGMKRAYDDGTEANADGDEEMDATDVEDEGGDVVQPSMFNAPAGRKIGGRRGLSKTQSLPAAVFNGADF